MIGQNIYGGHSNGDLFNIEISNKNKPNILNNAHDDWISVIKVINEGKLLTGSHDNLIKLWNFD